MVAATSRMTTVLRDFDGDTKQTSLYITPLAADGSNYAVVEPLVQALFTSIDLVTLGVSGGQEFGAFDSGVPGNAPLAAAQTRTQIILEYSDNVNGREFTSRIGTADLTTAGYWTVASGKTVWDLTSLTWQDFKTNFEAVVRSEDNNLVTLNNVYVVD